MNMNIPVTDNGKPVQPGDSYFKYKGVYHPVVWVGDTPYRPRVETLVLMNGNAVYARIKDEDRRGSSGNGECYELPGGSIDADCEPIQQAENEVNEEALIAVKNIYDTGIQYYADYPSGFIMSGGDTPLEYAGHISTVYVAEYDGMYDRDKVEKKDLDPKISENGKFYPITKMVPLFRQEHINALLNSPYVSDAVKGAIRIINRKSNPTPKKNPVASDKIVGELFFVSRLGNLEYMKGSTFKNGRLHIDTEGKSVIRVFSSVEDAINGYDSVLDKLTSGTSVYVYTIKNKADKIICPTTQQSPSSKITSEMWIPAEEPVDVKRVGLICITDTGKSGKYYYGKNSLLVGTLPKFRYTWTIKDRVTNVMESNVLVKDNKIYHGSTYLIDKFVPMSLDLGNATQEPGWSTFAFADYTLALRFGLMRAIQKVKEYYKDRCKDVVCSWSAVDKKPFISSDQYKFMKPLIMNFKYYVYTIDSTDLDLGIGNDENFPEITFRESGVVPESTDVIKIDEPLLKEHLLILPGDMTIEEYTSSQEKMMNRAHNRGWYAIMMTKDYNNGLASAQLQKAVRDGYLKPGDDISTYMSKSGIVFDDDSISIKSYLTESSDKIEDIYESKSTINSKYKPKGKKSLSSFKRVHLTQTIIDRYKREYPLLKHVRCKDTDEYICDGYIWFDDNELVGMVGSCEYTDDKTKWVVSLEITNQYRGYGLSKQILDYAVKTMNCKYLSVNKNNKVAKKVYDDYGFKVYQEDNTMYYMTIDKNNKDIGAITESLLISKGVFDVNFEDFESGKSNVVLITGLSGSGKSTLGQKIADKYKAELVELDLFEQCYMFENDEQLKEAGEVFYVYLSHHKDIWDKLKKKELLGKELSNEIEKFLKYAITWCKSDKKNKYVLEGVQIYSFLNKEKINGVPILFVGTSALKSLIRRLSRAREHSKEDFKNEISKLPQCIAWYIAENKDYEKFKKSVLESAEYSSVNKYPVFIILMHTGTPLSTTIKTVTHDEFSHAAVSFNSKLDPLYSFGTKKYGHHEHGLVQHNTKDDFYRHYHATYSVFVMYVSKEQRDKMLTRLRYFIENEANIKFDIASLIACAMQIPTEFRKKFFCSRFVMEIIGQGIELSKYPSMWTPQQISELDNITMVNKGDDLYMYDYRITEKNLKKIRDGKLDDIVLESSYPKESANYYRVEHNGVGIYEAYKNNVSLAQWKKFKSSKACTWLPVPTISYESGCISYFTEDGLQYFRTFTLPEISKEIPPNMISIEKVHVSEDTVVYRDNYQIVVRGEAMESVRSELPDSEFGLPDKRKYPLHDPAHVQSAIKFFNYVSEEDEKELAKNILKKIDEYDMKGEISVTKKNRFFKYAKSSGIMEAIDIQSDTDKDCMNQLVMGLPTDLRTKVIEKLSRYNPSNIIYEDCLYVNGCIASALTVYKDSVDKSMAHMIVVENEKSKSSDMESMINDVISGISLMYEDIETLCVLSLPAHMDVPCIMDLQREKSDIVYEGYHPIPVMEAPNEDDDTATDYTEDVADDDGGGDAGGEETATDYTEDADTGEDGDTTDDTGTEEENPDDTTTEEEGDQGGDTGEDELQATDYTDGTDTGEDTPGDAEGTATDGGTPRNGNLIDNNVLKNYSVLRNFEKLYNLTKEVSDSLDSVVMPSKLQNTVLAQVLKNLNSIKEFILSYVKFQFSSDNYAQNLYYYNLVLQTLNLNLELLKSNKELEDTKLSKKNSRR